MACGYFDSGTAKSDADSLNNTLGEDAIRSLTRNSIPSELLGTWQNVEIKVGEMRITNKEMELQTREFRVDSMHIRIPGNTPQAIPYGYNDGKIISEQEGEETIEKLTRDTLIVSRMVDGSKAKYIFVR